MAPIAPDALERWTYRKSGMDYGPFSTHDIHELIKRHEIDGETELFNVRARERRPLNQWPSLARFLEEHLRIEAEEKKRQEVLHEVSRLERTVERQRRLPVFFAVLVILAGSIAAYLVFRGSEPVSRGYPLTYFRELALEALPRLAPEEIAALRPKTDGAKEDTAHHRPRSRNGKVQPTSPSIELDKPTPIEVDLTGEESGGRQLAMEDLDRVQKAVSPGLVACFREEARDRPDFEGGSVVLYVMANGDVRVSRLVTKPQASAELGSCARRAVSGVRIPPFSGPAQVMNIPIYVSSMR